MKGLVSKSRRTMNAPIIKYESSRGKYKVFMVGRQPVIQAKRDDSPFYIRQSILVDGVDDLKDLFITIASVLNQIYDTDDFSTTDDQATP